jgi:hypothetical protein
VLGISRAAEERAEFYIAHLTARRSVRLMPDEGRARRETRPMTPASSKASLAAVSPKLRCIYPIFGDPPFFGSFLADQKEHKLSVFKAAVSQRAGLKDRRSPHRRGCSYGRPHHLRQKGEGAVHPLKIRW